MHRIAPRHARTVLCVAAALPVLLVTGCSSDSDDQGTSSPSASTGESSKKPAPAKYKELPDSCKTVKKKTIKSTVPGAESTSGKRVGSGDLEDSSSCLWTGLKKYDYRQLTVTLKRHDSDASLGSGNKRAAAQLTQDVQALEENKDFKGLKKSSVKGLGDEATSVTYQTSKKAQKKSEDFRGEQLLVRKDNVVATVSFEGAGFSGGEKPSEKSAQKNAEDAAKDVIAALK